MLKVGFLGSSSLDGFESYKQDLKEIIEFLFDCDKNLMIVSGGYQGLMEEVSKLAIKIKNERNLVTVGKYNLNILGILFDGYQKDPQNENPDYTVNQPNIYNDLIISTTTIPASSASVILSGFFKRERPFKSQPVPPGPPGVPSMPTTLIIKPDRAQYASAS